MRISWETSGQLPQVRITALVTSAPPPNSGVPKKYTLSLNFTAPHLFRECCWLVEKRGFVGETLFHVCFLMGTQTHIVLARRLLKHYPKMINDVYLSEEYYGMYPVRIPSPVLTLFSLCNDTYHQSDSI